MLSLHTTFKSFAFVLFLLTVFASCYNNSNNNVEVIKALNESIENSSNWFDRSSKDIMISFEEKLRNDGSRERAQFWYPKAKRIEQLSGDIFNYIENIKNDLDSKGSFSSELFDKLVKYKYEILVVDPQITHEFQKSFGVFTKTVDSSKTNQKTLFQNYFKTSITSVATMLNKLQNNIRVIENKIILFCHEHVGSTDGHGFATSISVVSIINSSVVQPGDDIEILSGIGEFNTFYKPEVLVYGKLVPIDETGVAVSKLKAPTKPGKYSVPIKIQYTDQDGRQQTFQKEIEYKVANIQKQ